MKGLTISLIFLIILGFGIIDLSDSLELNVTSIIQEENVDFEEVETEDIELDQISLAIENDLMDHAILHVFTYQFSVKTSFSKRIKTPPEQLII